MSPQDPDYLSQFTDTGQLNAADDDTKHAFQPGDPADESGGWDEAAPELDDADDEVA